VTPFAFVVVSCALFGLAVGSFLNVVIHRVPRKESVVRPPSHCPSCDTPIRPRDNIPVLSWLLLKGRCRQCQAPIAGRYPAVEALTAALFAAVGARLADSWALPAFLVLTAALVAITAVDLELFVIPNRILYPALFLSAPLLVMAAVVGDDMGSLRDAALGGVLAWVLFFVIHLVSPRGMGFGDVRLAGLVGLHLGWLSLGHVAVGLFAAFCLAAVLGVGLIATGVRSRKDKIPFGPFLALGAGVALFLGQAILDWYLP